MPSSSKTAVKRQQLYDDRWSGLGREAGVAGVSDTPSVVDLQKLDLFADYEASFLERHAQDIAFVEWEQGAVLFEEGSYLDVAFYILEGEVEVFLNKHREASPSESKPIFNIANILQEESKDDESLLAANVFQSKVERKKEAEVPSTTFLASMDFDLHDGRARRLGPGDVFGEIGALNGWPQSVTARTATPCTLVQIRLPALRALKKKSTAFKEFLDAAYRERTLLNQLQTTPLFKGVDQRFLEKLSNRVELISCEPGEELVPEGETADALYLVRSGFLKLSTQLGDEPMAVSYLSKGQTLGEVELLMDDVNRWQYTATSTGYSELVKIERVDFEALLDEHSSIRDRLWNAAVQRIKKTGYTRLHPEKADLIDFSLERGLAQGNSILMIDLDVCTRCDDCVRGCENTHGGRPRFVREGEKYGNFLITRACLHCEDPVCLVGCPTGAIHRTNVAEVVDIDDDLCIGCGNCASKCPYDAITMHDTGETWSDEALPTYLRGRDRQVASKCDLCYESEAGPACVNNCPHSCAFRVGSLDEVHELLEADQTPS